MKYKNARYGKSDAEKRDDAKSPLERFGPLTDHALIPFTLKSTASKSVILLNNFACPCLALVTRLCGNLIVIVWSTDLVSEVREAVLA
jgi:hypothetical protein